MISLLCFCTFLVVPTENSVIFLVDLQCDTLLLSASSTCPTLSTAKSRPHLSYAILFLLNSCQLGETHNRHIFDTQRSQITVSLWDSLWRNPLTVNGSSRLWVSVVCHHIHLAHGSHTCCRNVFPLLFLYWTGMWAMREGVGINGHRICT